MLVVRPAGPSDLDLYMELAVLSGRESSVRRLDLLREAVGDNPADWCPALTGHAWPGGKSEAEEFGAEEAVPFRQAAE